MTNSPGCSCHCVANTAGQKLHHQWCEEGVESYVVAWQLAQPFERAVVDRLAPVHPNPTRRLNLAQGD